MKRPGLTSNELIERQDAFCINRTAPVDEDHHTNNGHARNSGKKQWIKHWTLHWPVLGLAPPGGHAKSENRPVGLELPSAGKIWERLHPQTVDAFGGCFQTQPPLGSVNTRLGGG